MTTSSMVVCPVCASENAASTERCATCGAPLGDRAVGNGARPGVEERRMVTIVTSDWKGSTSIGERLDAEALREVQTRYFDEMRLVFEAHGGVIEKIIGDAIVAVFGHTVAHDDDALRAVAAASESLRTLTSLNEQFEQTYGIQLVVRTGVATGEVVVSGGSTQHLLTGDVPQVATAMEQNAPPNEVLLADSTRQLLGDQIQAEPMGAVPVKGSPLTVGAYRLVAVSDEADRALREAEAGATGPSVRESTPRAAPERRKTVTIVFANPRISPEGGGKLGPRELQEVMTRYFAAMRGILEKHGATVEKFIGDAVMAVFGLPVLHEDDALRASRAAIEMQTAMRDLNAKLAVEWGATVQQQIGVNTGEVVAGDASLGERLVTGDVVNVAARLEQAAPPLEVLMGELTHRLVRDAVNVEPVEPLTLKGKAEPVPAYRLLSVSRAVEGFRRREDSPMVGREAEMGSLSEMLFRARHERAGRMATVVADAGTGKSRLIREFVNACDTTSIVIRGKCLSYGDGITFWPLVEAARGAASIGADDTPDEALAKLRTVIRDAAVVDRIAATIGLTREQFTIPEIQWATRKMLEELGHEHPVIWFIDDIHWAEQTLLDLLVHLLDYCEGPLLLLCSSRPDLLERHADWGERQDSVRIVLKPLSDADAGQVVHNLLGKAGISTDVQDRIVAAAEGNPLYVEQMLSMLMDSGRLRKVEDRWEPTVDLSQMAIPPSIQALIASRLDLLNSEERAVIEPASVIGVEFAQAAVSELAPSRIQDSVAPVLSAMSRKQLVRSAASTNLDEASYRFMHILIKDAAYGGILKRARADLHERFVDWAQRANLETGRSQEYEEIHGYHLEQAYRYLAELGPLDQHGHRLGERASDLLASAGRRAQVRGDSPAASSLLRRAASTRLREDRARLGILLDLAQELRELGEFGEAETIIAEAGEIASRIGDEATAAKARLIQLYLQVYTGETGESDSWSSAVADAVERALPLFETARDEAGATLAWRLRVGMYMTANRYADMAAALSEVMRHANAAGDVRTQTRTAFATAHALLYGPTPVDEAISRCEQLVELASSDQSAAANVRAYLGQLYAMRGDFAHARELCSGARATLMDLGAEVLAASTDLNAAGIEVRAGNLPGAEQVLRRSYEQLTSMGETFLRSSIGGQLARTLVMLGRPNEAAALLQEVDAIAAPDDVDARATALGTRARLLAAEGSTAEALSAAVDALGLRRASDSPVEQADALIDLAEVQQRLGMGAAARSTLPEALELLGRKGDVALAAQLRVTEGAA